MHFQPFKRHQFQNFAGGACPQSDPPSLKVMLHWPTCNANLQRRFATHVSRTNLQTCYTFESLSKTCKTLQHCKYRKKSFATGHYTEWFFAQHRIIASWRCKLTSVTPPLWTMRALTRSLIPPPLRTRSAVPATVFSLRSGCNPAPIKDIAG